MKQTRGRGGILAAVALCALGYGAVAAGQAGDPGLPEGTLAYVPSAARVGGLDGFVRVVNRGSTDVVEITGFDDTGAQFGPVGLLLPGGAAVMLTSADLEAGNAAKGLPVGLGDGSGDWRLQFHSDSFMVVDALVRTPDRFMTSVQGVVAPMFAGWPLWEGWAAAPELYRVGTFNPGSNTIKASFLRLVNPGDGPAAVTIDGIDDLGVPYGDVRLTVPARGAVRVTASELEAGGEGLEGSLGDGSGKWRLRVESSRSLFVMNLLRSQTASGVVYVSNLSAGSRRAASRERPIHAFGGVLAYGRAGQYCEAGTVWQWDTDRTDGAEGLAAVINGCSERAFGDCTGFSFSHCASLATGWTARRCWGFGGTGLTAAAAEADALRRCREDGAGNNCRIYTSSRTGNNATYCNSTIAGVPAMMQGPRAVRGVGEEASMDSFPSLEAADSR